MKRLRWPRFGLRREILILLPVTVFLLVLVGGFTLFAYRSAVDLLTEDRQREVAVITRQLAEDLASGPWPDLAELRRQAPTASRFVILTPDGQPIRTLGQQGSGEFLAPLQGQPPLQVVVLAPDRTIDDMLIGYAPFTNKGQRYILRLDVPARELSRQRQAVRVLTWFVLPSSLALLLLTLVFLPHFLRPYDTLVEKVQKAVPDAGDQDDISTLVSTVESALAALASAAKASPEDDIAALQRALGASLESGLLLLDNEGRVLTLNRVGGEMLELGEIAEPTPVSKCLQPHPELLQMLLRAIEDGEGLPRQELQIDTSEGPRTLGFTVHNLRRDDGTVRGHLALFADLTQSLKEAEARQLATNLEQLGELAAGVAHELRNSLATLRGYLTLIERHPDKESITDYLQEIRRESDQLQRVVEDFLLFAQPESARVETVDLQTIVRAAASDPALAGMGVEVQTERSREWLLQGDAQLLERAIRNLLHNAAQAERDGGGSGPLRLTLRQDARHMELLIEDRGPGLPDAVRQRLFQPFVTSRPGGVGLGLSLAQRIVTLHGGRVEVEDRSGGGTRFRLDFPSGAFE